LRFVSPFPARLESVSGVAPLTDLPPPFGFVFNCCCLSCRFPLFFELCGRRFALLSGLGRLLPFPLSGFASNPPCLCRRLGSFGWSIFFAFYLIPTMSWLLRDRCFHRTPDPCFPCLLLIAPPPINPPHYRPPFPSSPRLRLTRLSPSCFL